MTRADGADGLEIGVYVMAPPNRAGTPASALTVGAGHAGGKLVTTDQLGVFAQHAEAVGFDTIWLPDHVVMPGRYSSKYPYQAAADDGSFQPYPFDDVPFPEPMTALSYIAGATRTIRLSVGVVILTERNPVLFAKQAATLDALSGGRLQVGVGVGWLREEYDALGIPWEGRGRRLDEYMVAMRALWQPGRASYHGEFVNFDDIGCDPKPVAPSGIPLIVGGHSEAAARRAGKLGDGFVPSAFEAGDPWPLVESMKRAADAAGRDCAAIDVYMGSAADAGMVEDLARRGATGVFLAVFPTDLDSALRWLDDTADRVLAQLR
jgi:probable F420-dependent oxidoreductase